MCLPTWTYREVFTNSTPVLFWINTDSRTWKHQLWVSESHAGLQRHLTGITGGVTGFYTLDDTFELTAATLLAFTLAPSPSAVPVTLWKPVTSGDSASQPGCQPRPWYIDYPQPQPSCPAVLSSMLSLSTGCGRAITGFWITLDQQNASAPDCMWN